MKNYSQWKLRLAVIALIFSFEWTAPHTMTTLELDDSGTILNLEGMSPDYLGRRGWNRYSLAPDDAVEVAWFPSKTGASEGLLLRVTLEDGAVGVSVDNP